MSKKDAKPKSRRVLEIEKAIDECREEIANQQEMLKDWLNEWAALNCPYKVGERVTVKGYTHTGKTAVIESVCGKIGYSNEPEWVVRTKLVKKDGSLGTVSVEWGSWHEDKYRSA